MLRLFPRRLPRPSPVWDHPRQRGALLTYASLSDRRYASASTSSTAEEVKRPNTLPAHDAPPAELLRPQPTDTEKPIEPSSSHPAPSAESSSSNTKGNAVQQHPPEPTRSSSDGSQPQFVGALVVDGFKGKVREWSENAIIAARERADRYTASAIKSFAQLGRELNKVTGYGEIEGLKRRVAEQETRIQTARLAARTAKSELERAIQQRQKSQREVNDLLSRKSTWTDDDVVRFTALVRQDHLYEQAESSAKLAAAHTEDAVDREFSELMRVILNRYHEEQIWSDKIRSASTYGSLTVMGLNMLVFIMAIIIVEPWKRRRLAQTFENKVEEMSGETIRAFEERTGNLQARLVAQEEVLGTLVEVVTLSQAAEATAPTEELVEEALAEEPPLSEPTESEQFASSVLRALHITTLHDRELFTVVATSAAAAGIVGWVARSWFGR